MANSLSTLNREFWSRRVQYWIKRSSVFMAIASFEERDNLTEGTTVHRPYISDFTINTYTKGTAVTIQDISSTDETLVINVTKEVSFYVDKIDEIQNYYNAADEWSKRAAYRLSNDMDGDFFEEVENATYDFDDGDVTNTNSGDGNPIIMSTSNAVEVFSKLKAKMNQSDIEGDRPWDVVIDPVTASFIEQQVVANGFNTADLAIKNGFAGDFLGFKVFVSNNLLHEIVLTSTGNVSADDTFVIGGVTFTFKAAPASAGEVDVGSDAETSLSNLAAAINGGAGAGTAYIELSAANRATLTKNRVAATSTATTLTVTSAGLLAATETLTNVTASDIVVKCLAERRGAIDMVVQRFPELQINKVQDKLGYNFITYDLYGIKTFQEGKDRMVELNIKAGAVATS